MLLSRHVQHVIPLASNLQGMAAFVVRTLRK